MNIIERYNRQMEFADAVVMLVMAFQYLLFWIVPSIDDGTIVNTLTVMILFEFIMIHSGVFMSMIPTKYGWIIFVPIYGFFVYQFAAVTSLNYVMIVYLLAVLNRMRYVLFRVPVRLRKILVIRSVFSAAIYVILMVFVLLSWDYVPRFGLTEDYVMGEEFVSHSSGNHLEIEKTVNGEVEIVDVGAMPHLMLAVGFLYYLCMSWVEFVLMRRLHSNKSAVT